MILVVVCGFAFWIAHNNVKDTVTDLLAENKIVVDVESVAVPYSAPVSSNYIVPVTVSKKGRIVTVNFRVAGYFWERQSIGISGFELIKLKSFSGKGIFSN